MADYTKTEPPVQLNPIGIDLPITSIQLDLSDQIPWLEVSFGRAKLQPTKDSQPDAPKRYEPKVYKGNKGYQTVLPNDNFIAESFMHVLGEEKVIDYQMNSLSQNFETPICLIVWVNLLKINKTENQLFTEQLKADVLKVLYQNSNVIEVSSMLDEDARKIFSPFTVDEFNKELLMYPFQAFRFEMKIGYESFCQ